MKLKKLFLYYSNIMKLHEVTALKGLVYRVSRQRKYHHCFSTDTD